MKIAKTGLVLNLLQHEKKKDYREQFISIRLSDYRQGCQKEGSELTRRAGGQRKRSEGKDGKGEQRRAKIERKGMVRNGDLEEIEGEEKERRRRPRRRRGDVGADRLASAAVSWTGSRCSETGGSRMVRLTDACTTPEVFQ